MSQEERDRAIGQLSDRGDYQQASWLAGTSNPPKARQEAPPIYFLLGVLWPEGNADPLKRVLAEEPE